MTAKQFLQHPTFQLLATAAAIGVMWGTIKSEVGQKADRQEVAATAASLAAVTEANNAKIAAQLSALAADTKDIKAILCARASADSFCRRTP